MPLTVERSGDVTTLTLDRPEAYNALDPELRDAVLDALATAENDGTRCVVIRGAGPGFCAGMDLNSLTGQRGVEITERMRNSAARVAERLLGTPLPLVVAVHGACAGVGLTFALAADHCIAADSARFLTAFISRSLVPDGATTHLLPRLVGLGRAKRMLLFGEAVTAHEALETGLVGEVVPEDQLADVAAERAAQLAALPTQAVTLTKSLLARSFDIDLATVLFEERALQGLISTTADYDEGRAAFREKRPPRFQGR